ncbi:MAG: hypothetical protein WB985_04165 [Candidatus Acidiferrales bacterium]
MYFNGSRRSVRCCCLTAAAFLLALLPARAQTTLPAEFASIAFTDFPSETGLIAPETTALTNFDRYHILPCEYLDAPAASARTCASPAPKYHLDTNLSFDPSNAASASEEHSAAVPDTSTALPFTTEPTSRMNPFLAAAEYQDTKAPHAESFHWWPALQQSFFFLLIEHGFRIADDPFLRYLLWHKPFWHDYVASTRHFYFDQWGDGDDFIVNYIGHPMEGGVTGNIQIQNDPRGRSLTFGKSRAYWMSRMRAMAWSAVFSAQFEAGPIFSEAAIGNEGGYFYKPGCDPYLSCSKQENKAITNNTGWVDFVITPVVGTGWIVLEDAIEAELTDRWAPGQPDDALKWKLMRASLSPTHVMANFVAGKMPWYRYRIYGPDDGNIFPWMNHSTAEPFSFEGVQRWEVGAHYSFLSLPVATESCASCRVNNSGFGFNAAYRITNRLWVDNEVNFYPGSGGYGKKGSMTQGMFGPRYGYTGKNWGWYFKLRPGFIYYDKTLTIDSGSAFTEATRFAFDVGSVFEWFATRHSTVRIDAGTTVVRYLTSHTDPRQPAGDILSTDYYVSQSNFQLTTGYTYRF